jgi:glutamyl-tRNA synthetase
MTTQVRVRFAPSPTGYMHIGNARTAIVNWLFARHFGDGGTFILRIEDTDRARSTDDAVQVILDSMRWLGLDWDEGPYFQSERFDLYVAAANRLVETGKAYRCYCTPEELALRREAEKAQGKDREGYDGRCRDLAEPREGVLPSIRLRTPDTGTTEYDDLIQGRIVTPNAEIDDRVILRSDGSPTYNLSVVVDDHDMAVTHIIRGADHMTNTPVQVLLYEAFGWDVPKFAHQPLILGPDRKKISKRHRRDDDPDYPPVQVTEYREDGILPEALFNGLLRMGWSHGDQEVFTRDEAIALFDIADCSRSPGIFDLEKLRSTFSHHFLRLAPPERLLPLLADQLRAMGLAIDAADPRLALLVGPLSERARTMREMALQARPLLVDAVALDERAVAKHLKPAAKPLLLRVADALEALGPEPTEQDVVACFHAVAESAGVGLGKVAQPCRVALVGTDRSPGIDLVVRVVGVARATERIRRLAATLPDPV